MSENLWTRKKKLKWSTIVENYVNKIVIEKSVFYISIFLYCKIYNIYLQFIFILL